LYIQLIGHDEHERLFWQGNGQGIFRFFRKRYTLDRIKILIADDQWDFRNVLHNFLDGLPNVSVVGEAMNGNDAVNKVEELLPDVVLMDISMPLINGIEATRIIKHRWPATKILVVSNFDDPNYRNQAFEAHADGFISKSTLMPSLEAMFGVQNDRP
jgi:DNA-binding NarL/FixJ family response regulator